MKIFKDKHSLLTEILDKKTISFVPTMGGLHKGHISLIKKTKSFSGQNLVTIFVNPRQFNTKKDFIKYPRNLDEDLKILKRLKVNFVYIPDKKDIFSFKPKKKVYLDAFSKKLCGQFRKGHFEGVLDIVNRFLEIIKPKRIFLGNKDYQQLYLINKHIIKKKIGTIVVRCKTIRNKNGVAYSTRNKLLNKRQILIGSKVYKYLLNIKKSSFVNLKHVKKNIVNLGVKKIDYLEIYDLKNHRKSNKFNKHSKIFIAYYLNNVRLIDNI